MMIMILFLMINTSIEYLVVNFEILFYCRIYLGLRVSTFHLFI